LLLASFATPIVVAAEICQLISPDGAVRIVPCCTISEDICAYKIANVTGLSKVSWKDAAKQAIAAAKESPDTLISAKVVKLVVEIEEGKIVACRCRLKLSFKIGH
jgi:flavin-binding protein dodecin